MMNPLFLAVALAASPIPGSPAPTATPQVTAAPAPVATARATPGRHHHHGGPTPEATADGGTVLMAPEETKSTPVPGRAAIRHVAQSDSYRLKQSCRKYLYLNTPSGHVTRLLIARQYALCVYDDSYRTGAVLFKRDGDDFVMRAVGAPTFDDAKTLQSFGVPDGQAHLLIQKFLAD